MTQVQQFVNSSVLTSPTLDTQKKLEWCDDFFSAKQLRERVLEKSNQLLDEIRKCASKGCRSATFIIRGLGSMSKSFCYLEEEIEKWDVVIEEVKDRSNCKGGFMEIVQSVYNLRNEFIRPPPPLPQPTETDLAAKYETFRTPNIVPNSTARQQLEFFGNMRKSGHLVDICFEAPSDADPSIMVKLHAHRLVLALRSPVFAAMFTNNMKEANNASIQLKDISATTLEALLDYIYADTIPSLALLSVPRLIDILNAAHCYLLENCIMVCANQLAQKLSVDNLEQIYTLAIRFNITPLKEYCKWYAGDHDILADMPSSQESSQINHDSHGAVSLLDEDMTGQSALDLSIDSQQ